MGEIRVIRRHLGRVGQQSAVPGVEVFGALHAGGDVQTRRITRLFG